MERSETAIVVGGTGAFGQAIVRRLSARGLRILAAGRHGDELDALAKAVPGVEPCIADLSSDTAVDAIRKGLGGPVRMVVHGPGVPVAGGILDAPTEALTQAVNIKVGGMLRLVRAADAHLVKGSRLVAIGGHYGFEPTAYAATAGIANAAIANLMRQLSWALGPRGITAHLLAPGPADTERLRNVAKARAATRGISSEQVLDEMKAESAIGAFTTPEQVAWAVSLLADPEADALAGSALMLDSGRRRGLP
jgi:NAD(P)-dependent dehydrogenase (short-subunit alcohol dehydrogenase family)